MREKTSGKRPRMASKTKKRTQNSKTPRKPRLTIELVPTTVWLSSLYKLMPKENWEALKKEIYEKEGRKCYVCGSARSPFELHEFWEYDDKKHIQKLTGMHHLCMLCHMVKHIGFHCCTADGREKLKRLGLARKDLIAHFCRVNNCSEREFLQHENEAFRIWEGRSNHKWEQDFGKYRRSIEVERSSRSASERPCCAGR